MLMLIYNLERRTKSDRTGHMITRTRHPVPACWFTENQLFFPQSCGVAGHIAAVIHPQMVVTLKKRVHVNI